MVGGAREAMESVLVGCGEDVGVDVKQDSAVAVVVAAAVVAAVESAAAAVVVVEPAVVIVDWPVADGVVVVVLAAVEPVVVVVPAAAVLVAPAVVVEFASAVQPVAECSLMDAVALAAPSQGPYLPVDGFQMLLFCELVAGVVVEEVEVTLFQWLPHSQIRQ